MTSALLFAALGSQVACVPPKRQAKAQARVDLGAAYLVEGSTEIAIQQLQEAVKMDRRNYKGWEQLGLAYMKRGAIEPSEEAFQKALKLVPGSASVNLNYSYLLLRMDRADEAIPVLETALLDLTYRSPALILNNLGYALYLTERYPEAELRLQEATSRSGSFCQAWFNLGLTREAQENRRGAVRAYEQVVTACPEDAAGSYLKAGTLLIALEGVSEGCGYLLSARELAHGTALGDEASLAHNQSCGD